MNESDKKGMFALLLALQDLEEQEYFSGNEKLDLRSVGEQLWFTQSDPTRWEFVKESIDAIFEANSILKKRFQEFLNQINPISFDFLLSLLPTEEELESELPKSIYQEKKGHFEIEPELESNEILNVTILIFIADNPIATAKKLSFLQRVKEYITKSKPNS